MRGKLMSILGGTDTTKRYRFIDRVGEGGMSTVYRAEDRETLGLVAVKLLHDDLARYDHSLFRFEREARILSALNHPLIVKCHGAIKVSEGSNSDKLRPGFVMDYLEGKDLFDTLRDEKVLDTEETAMIMLQLALAFDYVHRRGIVHRDMKPEQVSLQRNGCPSSTRLIVYDFGICGFIGDNLPYANNGHRKLPVLAPDERRLTAHGTIFGTPEYVSPEEADGSKHVDGRSDLYALGIMMYQMISGKLPFRGGNKHSIISRQIYELPAPFAPIATCDYSYGRRQYQPSGLDAVCFKLLEKDPDKRHQTGRELAYAVLNALPDIMAERLLLSMSVGLLGMSWNQDPKQPKPDPIPEIETAQEPVQTTVPPEPVLLAVPELVPQKKGFIDGLISFFLAPDAWIRNSDRHL